MTTPEDALACVEEGVDAIGINFVLASPRFVDDVAAEAIVAAVGRRALVVGVVAGQQVSSMLSLRERLGLGCLQLHGDEPPEALSPLLPHAYKAVRVASAADVARADVYGGDHVLLDAMVPGKLGGTGTTFQWSWARPLAERRAVTLAGGLHAGNVAEAIAEVGPYCVDVASGVEVPREPRRKDRERLRAFVRASRGS